MKEITLTIRLHPGLPEAIQGKMVAYFERYKPVCVTSDADEVDNVLLLLTPELEGEVVSQANIHRLGRLVQLAAEDMGVA